MKQKFLMMLMVLCVSFFLAPEVFADDPPTTPGIPKANKILFTETQIFWTESTDDIGVSGYKVYRDGIEVGDVTATSFSDSGLTADTEYIYTIKAYDTLSQLSTETDQLVLQTLPPLTCDHAQDVMDVVESVDPGGLTADELITAVQNAFTNLGYDPTLNNIERNLLIELIEKQIDLINTTDTTETPTTRADDQNEIDQLLLDKFNGNSLLSVYNAESLIILAEKHFKAGKVDSALLIYDYALEQLSDVNASVYTVLLRMSVIQMSELDENSTQQDKINALNAAKDTLMRYFDYFPGSTDHFAQMMHVKAAMNYFQKFPEVLPYSSYDNFSFDTAVAQIESAKAINNNSINAQRLARINYWELETPTVAIEDSTGAPITGSITVTNASDKTRFPGDPVVDERTIIIDAAVQQVPMYVGHSYSAKLAVNLSGSNPWVLDYSDLPHEKGKKYTYDHESGPVITDLADPNAPAEMVFVVDPPTAPYNLTAQKYTEDFTLSWDWLSPSGFTLKEFKVYRGGTEIGTVTTQSLADIPLDAGDNTFTYTVKAFDTSDNPSDESDVLTVTPDFDEQQQAYYDWKLLHFGTDPVDDYGDADGDGIANYHEFLLGSDPNLAPVTDVKSTITDDVTGLNAEYYNYTGTTFPDFDSMTSFDSEVVTDFTFEWHYDNVLGSGLSSDVAVLLTGYMDITTEGLYRFYHKSSSNSQLLIDGRILLDNNKSWSEEVAADIYLREGVHSIEIQYYDGVGGAELLLDWAGPGFAREEVPGSVFWYTPNPTDLLAETIVLNPDSDNDGVIDLLEYQNGTDINNSDTDGDGISDYNELYISNTDPLNVDSDGDGFSDFEELFVLFSDPNTVDLTNSITEVASVDGSSGIISKGEWQTTGSSIAALSINGAVEYTINVPSDGVYRLAVEVTENNRYSNNSNFSLGLVVDEAFVANASVVAPYGSVADAVFYLPNLASGNHTFRLVWNNITQDTFIQINNLRLQAVDGPDNDGNGIPDWIDNRLAQSTALTVPATTKTSPVCIEGANQLNIDTLIISGYYTPQGEDPVEPVLLPAPDNKWYSNITLSPDNPTVLDFNFQNGLDSEQKTCEWTETNVLQDADVEIRRDDSLLLTAFPEGAVSGTAVVTVEYEDHNITYDVNNSRNSFVHKFEVAGDYTISATYTPDGGGDPVTDSMNVKVVYSSFSSLAVAILNERRDWENPDISDESVIEADTYVNLFEAPLLTTGRLFDICMTQNKTGYIIARLGENGPIIDSKSVEVIDYSVLPENEHRIVETFEDGSIMVEGTIILSYIPSDLRIHLVITTTGITFDDGTTERWVYASDFDEYGVYKYRFLRADGKTGGNCHTIEIFQGDELLKKY